VYYVTFEVIRPQWENMEAALKKVKTVDDVLSIHGDFLDTTLKETLLTNQDLLKILTKLMSTCLLFSEEMKNFNDSLELDKKFENVAIQERLQRTNLDPSAAYAPRPDQASKTTRNSPAQQRARYDVRRQRISVLTEEVKRDLVQDQYKDMVARFSESFDNLLGDFMEKLFHDAHTQYHSHLSNLCTRLDFNGYWSEKGKGESALGSAGRNDELNSRFARASLGL